MKKELVLIGGGHAHMLTLMQLDTFINKGFGVTVIQPSEYHYYSGMGPGMLGGTYQPDELRFATKKQVESKGGRFVLGKAKRIDAKNQLVYLENASVPLGYDVLSCNTGSFVPLTILSGTGENVFTAKPIEDLLIAKQRILQEAAKTSITIAIVGSGPSSIEIAGNIHQLCLRAPVFMPRIQIFAGQQLLKGRPKRVQTLARKILSRKGIEIVEEGYVKQIDSGNIILHQGLRYQADIVFPSLGVKPSPLFAHSDLPIGPSGGLRVNRFLQSVAHSNIFGGGDCVYFEEEPLDKVGVYAVRQNPVLFHNLLAALENRQFESFLSGGSYMLIYNLGKGEGIFSKWGLSFSGKFAFYLKDKIDRKFIQRFSHA
nr:FAD-dependent oxidoreductase [uncultured Desulfobulbus sp.]